MRNEEKKLQVRFSVGKTLFEVEVDEATRTRTLTRDGQIVFPQRGPNEKCAKEKCLFRKREGQKRVPARGEPRAGIILNGRYFRRSRRRGEAVKVTGAGGRNRQSAVGIFIQLVA